MFTIKFVLLVIIIILNNSYEQLLRNEDFDRNKFESLKPTKIDMITTFNPKKQERTMQGGSKKGYTNGVERMGRYSKPRF